MTQKPLFASTGTHAGDIQVRLSYKIVELFSEGLYASAHKAIEELVSNSFDAGAQRVQVILSPRLHDQDATIVVVDDGQGMDDVGLKQHWLIGMSNKRRLKQLPRGRQQIGKFGIGKLATYVLADRLTHVSKSGGKYYSTSMDYTAIDRRVEKEIEPTTPIKISLRELTEAEAKWAIAAWTETPTYKQTKMPLFGRGAPASWTVAIMSSLKPKVHEIKQSVLEWVLRTALPLRPDFNIYLNGKKLSSSKEEKGLLQKWTLGQELIQLPKPGPKNATASEDTSVDLESEHRFGLDVPELGRITGYAEAYKDLLTGKSDVIGRSHGFFVYVFGRLVNVLDGHFGISPDELRHGTFGRVRVVVHMDGLDKELRSNREAVSEGPLLAVAQDVLRAIFNAVRSVVESHDQQEDAGASLARKLASSPASLSRLPIIELTRRVTEGKAASRYLSIPETKAGAERDTFISALEQRASDATNFVSGLRIDYEGDPDGGIAVYDTVSGQLKINAWHPFVAAFHEEFLSKNAGKPLELLAMAEVLAEAHLHAIGVKQELIDSFMHMRDQLLRNFANESGRRGAFHVAVSLQNARNNPTALEGSLCNAFMSLGFDVTPIGGAGEPDGVARANLAADSKGTARQYSVSLEAKSKQKDAGKVAAGTVFRYNALGETKRKTDQNGTHHDYTYDVLGRLTFDAITIAFGNPQNVDLAVRKLGYSFNTAGRPEKFTSYDSGNSVLNQVQRAYNGLGQLTAEYQNHSGLVNTSTSPKVQYTYSEMADSKNHSRLTSMVYPDGRTLHYGYSSGIDNTISRLSFMADDRGGTVGQHIEEYSYLGLATVVVRNHPQATSKLSYVKLSGESNGSQGDPYNGLDRFGRVADQRWLDGSDDDLDRFQYGYDSSGNVLYKENIVEDSLSELYHEDSVGGDAAYDKLNRLVEFSRGTLNGGNDATSDDVRNQVWDLDPLGNWDTITTNGTPSNRTHNKQNQIEDTVSGSLDYDANGNMTADETQMLYEYDAWNRLVAASSKTYAYDALGRRITEDPTSFGVADLYYSSMWQVLEEREGSDVRAQNVWSPVYVDALVLRDRENFGALDRTFGTGGSVQTTVVANAYASGTAVAVLSSGKIVVAGYGDSSNPDIVLVRYNSDGTVDTSFGDEGVATWDSGDWDYANDLLVQSNGQLVVVGSRRVDASYDDVLVVRFNADGSIDDEFGTDGAVIYDAGSPSDATYSGALLAGGKILVGGYTSTDGNGLGPLLVQLNSDGSFDTGFGTDGVVAEPTGSGAYSYATYGLAIQSDGSIVLAGIHFSESFSGAHVYVARYDQYGARDPVDYSVSTELLDSTTTTRVAIQSNGKILVAGTATGSGGSQMAVLRYESDLTLDEGFGDDGVALIQAGSYGTSASAMMLLTSQDGRILLGGNRYASSSYDFVLARLLTDGSPDAGFGTDGMVVADLGGAEAITDIALDASNNIVAAGWYANGYSQFTVARFGAGLGERLYVQQDANFNVTSIIDLNGTVRERFEYDPYGKATFLDGDFSVDGGGSDYDWIWLHQGGRQDGVTLDVHFRNRDLDTDLGRWKTQDPREYVDGLSVYEYVQSGPISQLDPKGTDAAKGIEVKLPKNPSNDLVLELLDLESRKDNDWSQNGNKEGPDGAWLAKEVIRVRTKLCETPTIFAYVERPIRVAGFEDATANALGNHAYVLMAAELKPGPVGYGIRGGDKGDVGQVETFQLGDKFSNVKTTYRNGLWIPELGKDTWHATDEELATLIRKHPMQEDYNFVMYNCQDWAKGALSRTKLLARPNARTFEPKNDPSRFLPAPKR